jgi:hypothetical protein
MKKITDSKDFGALVGKSYSYKFGKQSWSDWGLLFRFLVIICRLLDKDNTPPVKRRRKPSQWSLFLGDRLREGKTIQEAATLWRQQKAS